VDAEASGSEGGSGGEGGADGTYRSIVLGLGADIRARTPWTGSTISTPDAVIGRALVVVVVVVVVAVVVVVVVVVSEAAP
jgi:hypothetical protein